MEENEDLLNLTDKEWEERTRKKIRKARIERINLKKAPEQRISVLICGDDEGDCFLFALAIISICEKKRIDLENCREICAEIWSDDGVKGYNGEEYVIWREWRGEQLGKNIETAEGKSPADGFLSCFDPFPSSDEIILDGNFPQGKLYFSFKNKVNVVSVEQEPDDFFRNLQNISSLDKRYIDRCFHMVIEIKNGRCAISINNQTEKRKGFRKIFIGKYWYDNGNINHEIVQWLQDVIMFIQILLKKEYENRKRKTTEKEAL